MSSEKGVLHPKCGKRFPPGDRAGHCAACCESFLGVQAFDKHRRGGECLKPVEGQGFWLRSNGCWSANPPMTEEEREKIFGGRDD